MLHMVLESLSKLLCNKSWILKNLNQIQFSTPIDIIIIKQSTYKLSKGIRDTNLDSGASSNWDISSSSSDITYSLSLWPP